MYDLLTRQAPQRHQAAGMTAGRRCHRSGRTHLVSRLPWTYESRSNQPNINDLLC